MKIRPLQLRSSESDGTDNFCCCLTRLFLIIIGLVGGCLFLTLFGLTFLGIPHKTGGSDDDGDDRMTVARAGGNETDDSGHVVIMGYEVDKLPAYIAMQAFLGLLGLAHCFLVLGALCENRMMVMIFIAVDTVVSLVVIGLLCYVVSLLFDSSAFEIEENAGIAKSAGIIFILVVILPVVAIYAIVMAASCSYCNALA